jgi:hypothetical protein
MAQHQLVRTMTLSVREKVFSRRRVGDAAEEFL